MLLLEDVDLAYLKNRARLQEEVLQGLRSSLETAGPTQAASIKKTIEFREEVNRQTLTSILNYGSGTVFKVEGQMLHTQEFESGTTVEQSKSFEWYVAAKHEEEAREIFESQVSLQQVKIIPETISFNKISLKSFIN